MVGGRGCWGAPGPPAHPMLGRALVLGQPDPCPAEPGQNGKKSGGKKSICERQVKGRLQLNPPSGTSVTEDKETGVNWTKKPQQVQREETPLAILKLGGGSRATGAFGGPFIGEPPSSEMSQEQTCSFYHFGKKYTKLRK